MNKDELITKQQLEIESLKVELEGYNDSMNNIDNLLFCIGSPLNDSKVAYSNEQRKVFYLIEKQIILKREEE